MKEQAVFHKPEPNRPRRTPARVLFLFGLCLMAVTVITCIQRRDRENLEETEAPSALGDRQYFVLTEPMDWEHSIALLETPDGLKTPLYLWTDRAEAHDDTRMIKVGYPRESFFLYQLPETKDQWFVKLADGKFLPLSTKPRGDSP